jgi:hypothetical protein
LIVVLFCGAVWLWIWPTPEALEQQWQRQAGFDPLERYPPREANEVALQIEELVAPLGLSLAPQKARGRARPTAEGAERLAEVRAQLNPMINRHRQSGEMGALPPELAAYLTEARPILREVAGLLAGTPSPRWELQLDQGAEVPLINLLDHLTLHRLFIVLAAEAAREGDREASLAWHSASWKLRERLQQEPLVIYRMIAGAELADNLAFLRATPLAVPGWEEEVRVEDLRGPAREALRTDSWLLLRSFQVGAFEEGASNMIEALYSEAVVRRGIAAYFEAMDDALVRLETVDFRAFDPDAFAQEQRSSIPPWNRFARLVFPNSLGIVSRAARLEVGLVLTRLTLETRELLRAGDLEGLRALEGSHDTPVSAIQVLVQLHPDHIAIRASDNIPISYEHPVSYEHPLPLEIRIPLPLSLWTQPPETIQEGP